MYVFSRPRPSTSSKPASWCTLASISALIALVLTSGYYSGYHEGNSDEYTTGVPHGSSFHPMSSSPSASHCSDTCYKAKDGICDEGRVKGNASALITTPQLVSCDLGSDCSDCGPFKGSLPPPWAASSYRGPISFLQSMNKTLHVRHTTTSHSFLMPITMHTLDPDVSAMVWHYGALEGGITRVVHEVLNGRCLEAGRASERTVVDVGANLGYFSLYAAKYGCRVIAYEPVETFRAYLVWGVAVNGLGGLIHVSGNAISDRAQADLPIGVPKDKTYWGLASTNSLNLHEHETERIERVPSVRLDESIPEAFRSILLLKIDVEGYEPEVLLSAEGLFGSKSVENVLLEYSPGIAERHKNFTLLKMMPETLLTLLTLQGFAAVHLPGFGFSTPWPPKTMPETYSSPLPSFDEITRAALLLDVRASEMRRANEQNGKTCEGIPPELKQFGVWSSCSEFVYAAHPKGFRSAFGYNTNIWLSRRFERRAPGSSVARVNKTNGSFASTTGVLHLSGKTSSLFAPEQDMKVWVSQKGAGEASGGMKCDQIGSSHKVIFHCPCLGEDPGCLEQQKVVQKLLDQGLMPMQNW